jgi:hypothetical protein
VKEIQNMKARSSMLSIVGLAVAGSLGLGVTGASAQTIYFDPYAEPYPVVVAPRSVYVAPPPFVAPPPIVRERTVVVNRPAYVPAPVYGAPVPPYGYVGEVGYAAPDW